MGAVLITGMSGVGKSTVLAELARRGHRVVDTDEGDWFDPASPHEPLWRRDALMELLTSAGDKPLFVAGTVANQGEFYGYFTSVVLLHAPLEVMLERIAVRDTNDFGKSAAEREKIIADTEQVEPLLRAGATAQIDTRQPLSDVADEVERIAVA
ncbi:shikimate kinase [Stackebrandtia endophytica]|uniref:Shikimate kinase n=1 Tax=Stackebrandtia endophytica TaxID=1496996 RepID=A0A543AR24_9ACTN|nr:AAA family ATPase [Stackebrandtia endophytica]TQL75043.1 shikimate kinase [Stackebrandtia endophytica]